MYLMGRFDELKVSKINGHTDLCHEIKDTSNLESPNRCVHPQLPSGHTYAAFMADPPPLPPSGRQVHNVAPQPPVTLPLSLSHLQTDHLSMEAMALRETITAKEEDLTELKIRQLSHNTLTDWRQLFALRCQRQRSWNRRKGKKQDRQQVLQDNKDKDPNYNKSVRLTARCVACASGLHGSRSFKETGGGAVSWPVPTREKREEIGEALLRMRLCEVANGVMWQSCVAVADWRFVGASGKRSRMEWRRYIPRTPNCPLRHPSALHIEPPRNATVRRVSASLAGVR